MYVITSVIILEILKVFAKSCSDKILYEYKVNIIEIKILRFVKVHLVREIYWGPSIEMYIIKEIFLFKSDFGTKCGFCNVFNFLHFLIEEKKEWKINCATK